jgi:hypothetical protein
MPAKSPSPHLAVTSSEAHHDHGETLSAKLLTSILQSQGYRASECSDNIIESATSGSNFFISVQPDGWLQFGLSLPNRVAIDLNGVNDFNKSYRLGKLCLDNDKDIFFTTDMRVFTQALPESFHECVILWDQLVGLLLRFLQDRRELDSK